MASDLTRRGEAVELPLVLADGLDVTLYRSLRDAEEHLEADHVREGFCSDVAYDATGRLLDIQTEGNDVVIVAAESDPSHAADLEQALRDSLQALGLLDTASSPQSLSQLLHLASESGLLYHRPRTLGEVLRDLANRYFAKDR